MKINYSEEVLERIAYTCKKYYDKGASPQDLVSALSAQFFNILMECCEDGEEEFVLNEFINVLHLMKEQIIQEKGSVNEQMD